MYQELETKKVTQLALLRRGWFNPEYKLTDKVNDYGTLSYSGISKRNASAETASQTWRFNFKALFDRTILITDQNGVIIGECTRGFFSRKIVLTLQSGFSAEFYRASFWSREYVWDSVGYGKVMSLKNHFPFTLTTDVFINNTKTPAAIIPLLIFLGAHLIILQRRKRAVH